MIPFSNTPWSVDLSNGPVNDSTGSPIVYMLAHSFCDEERATILRAISQLPFIFDILNLLCQNPDALPQDLHYAVRSVIAFVAPVEHSAEVLTNRWLHAQSDTCQKSEEALRKLTLSLSDTLNGDMSHYPQPVQDAFAHAMSLLNLSKHMKHE